MKVGLRIAVAILCVFRLGAIAQGVPKSYAIRAGKILTMAQLKDPGAGLRVINHGVILVSSGKIEALGGACEVAVPDGYAVIDASDRWVMPGIVEAHTHIAVEGGFNDMVTTINPELEIDESVNLEDIAARKAVTGGVTTIHTMPGSGTNLAGFTVIVKLDCSHPEEVIVREVGAMKIAQAYNPERRAGDLGATRMGMAWMLRQILDQAREYTDAWDSYTSGRRKDKPALRPELENMRRAFKGEIPAIVHSAEAWGILESMYMFHDEYRMDTIVTHTSFCGYMAGEEAAKREKVHVNIGPRLVDFRGWNAPIDGRFHGMGAEYKSRGVKNLSINTDAVGWGMQEELAFQASMAVHYGLDEVAAMEAITIQPARALGVDDRIGSLEVSKDADIVIKKGSLLDVTRPVDLVMINGRIVYQRRGANLLAKESPS
ncbi:MAG: amidohydrolase family protein [Phycisphaerales bacterium]|nr:MAG: amidohydrolase family protein [Phycisphaerales bacterium]